MRLVFFGTPEFAVPALDALARSHDVLLAVAQPDKPAGRGMKMQAPAVAVRARELGIPLVQPPKIRTPEFLDSLRALAPDLGIVIAYGKILPAALLEIPNHGFVNVHASVLPAWRGAAPIQRAIEAGDATTGVTIMRVDEELDHGAMLRIATTPIDRDERTPALSKRLSQLGAEALLPVLDELANGTAVDTPQDHARATHAAKIEKQEGEVRFDEPARVIYDRFRAFDPWPGIYVVSHGEMLKLTDIRPADGDGAARSVLAIDDGVTIACGDGAIRVVEMQRPGKPRTPAAAVARGLGWRIGERIP
ncbi:MAG TPA: methionyl-tRNA formyltransferase [Thermoanaerobaculia bacterium]|nr:methionyl-tRNA formyltransferase [Thermoanaerobaculia bacterium]